MENGRERAFSCLAVCCVCAGVDGWMERGRPVGVVVGATQVVVVLPVLRGRPRCV